MKITHKVNAIFQFTIITQSHGWLSVFHVKHLVLFLSTLIYPSSKLCNSKRKKVLAMIWGKASLYMVGRNGINAAKIEINMEVAQKTKNRATISSY
jgi:hypothetical protein